MKLYKLKMRKIVTCDWPGPTLGGYAVFILIFISNTLRLYAYYGLYPFMRLSWPKVFSAISDKPIVCMQGEKQNTRNYAWILHMYWCIYKQTILLREWDNNLHTGCVIWIKQILDP